LLFRYSANRSYIIKEIGVGVEILGLVREVLDDCDASHHEDDVLFAHHLELVKDGGRVYPESSIEVDLEAAGEVLLLEVLSDLCVLVLDGLDDLQVLLGFHSNRNRTI
jgi:hypothetical protein